MKNCTFALAHIHLMNHGFVRRPHFENDFFLSFSEDVFTIYSRSKDERILYIPSQEDLKATDWEVMFFEEHEDLHKNYLNNALIDMSMRFKHPILKSSQINNSTIDKYDLRVTKTLWFTFGFSFAIISVITILFRYGKI